LILSSEHAPCIYDVLKTVRKRFFVERQSGSVSPFTARSHAPHQCMQHHIALSLQWRLGFGEIFSGESLESEVPKQSLITRIQSLDSRVRENDVLFFLQREQMFPILRIWESQLDKKKFSASSKTFKPAKVSPRR
jgi:hypothetical protein